MFRAMALKELREIRGIVLLACVVYALLLMIAIAPEATRTLGPLSLLMRLLEQQTWLVPFVTDAFVPQFIIASAVLAIALGLSQTLSETVRGTYPFLLHRPVSRRWLMGVKISVGMVTLAVCAAVPLLVYALWAATPGTHASPFEWSMTCPAWAGWFAMTLLYLGAFLTGLRPARWYASRLLPLAAAGVGVGIVLGFAFTFQQGPRWASLGVVGADIWLILMILFVARTRDFS